MNVALAIVVVVAGTVVLIALLGVWFGRRGARAPLANIDPHTLSEPWRRYVLQAQSARRRYARALEGPRGPLRDQLVAIGARVDAGVEEVWRIARRGDALDAAIDTIGAARAQRRMDSLADTAETDARDQAETALAAQQESAARLQGVAEDAKAKLRLLDARLDEAVARGLELALNAGDVTLAGGLSDDVGSLVDEMEALRLALDEVGPGRSGTATA